MADRPPSQGAPSGPARAMSIPSEGEITPVLESLLRTCDLDRMTLRLVMASLARHFQVDPAALAERKKFVRHAIEHFLSTSYNPAEEAPDQRAQKEEDQVEEAGEEGSDSEDEGETKPAVGSKRPRAGARGGDNGRGKKVFLTNLEKAVILAEPLAEFLSELVLPRTHVAKRISSYIKEQGLQDPNDRRIIRCDEKLKTLFGTDSFTFFSVNKLTANLLYKVDEVEDEELKKMAEECNTRRLAEKQADHDAKVARGEFVGSAKKKAKLRKAAARASQRLAENDAPKKRNGLTKDMKLSDALAAVCGGQIMSRSQVVKQIWVYIKANNLQTKGKITCDEKLQAIFDGCKEVTNFGLNKYLSAHLTNIPQS